MKNIDYILEEFYKSIPNRPKDKNDETITTFNRDIFWYDRDNVSRQTFKKEKLTFEDHRKAVSTAVHILHKETPHEVALAILSHRFFEDYRNRLFGGKGNFYHDYSLLIRKISALFNGSNSQFIVINNLNSKLAEYTTPTLVSINHINGDVSEVKNLPPVYSLLEWANKLNAGAVSSTTYRVVGLPTI